MECSSFEEGELVLFLREGKAQHSLLWAQFHGSKSEESATRYERATRGTNPFANQGYQSPPSPNSHLGVCPMLEEYTYILPCI